MPPFGGTQTRAIKCWYWVLYIAYKQPVYVIFDLIETYSKSLRCKRYRTSVHAMGSCAVAEMNLQLGRWARVAANNTMSGQKVRDPWVYNNWEKEGVILLWNVTWQMLGNCFSPWCQCWCKDFRNCGEGWAVPPEWHEVERALYPG